MLFTSVAQISLAKLNVLQLLSCRRIHRLPATINPSCLSSVVGRVSEHPNSPTVWAHHRAQPRIWLPIINWYGGGRRERAQSVVLQCLGVGEGWGTVHGSSLVVTTTMDTMQLPPLLPPPGSACGLLTQPLHGKWHGVCSATVTPSPLASTAGQAKCACSGKHLSSPSGRLVSEVAPHSPSCGCILRIRPCGMLSVLSCRQPSSVGQQTSEMVR